MIACLIVQQVLVAASSWALVDFIRQTASPQNFHISSIVVLIVIAISPYIPGFISNYFYQLWIVFGRSQTTRNFLKLIDGRKDWVFNTKKRDDVFALQRENIALIDETSRFFYLNFPVVLNLIFNSVAIGFLLGRDIILGMLAGFAISGFQFLLVPFFTEKMQKQKQELHYEAEKSFLGSWQVITLQNQPFYGQSLQSINGNHQKSEVLSRHVHTLETFTNSLVSIASFVPLTLILLAKFSGGPIDQISLMSLGVLLPRILQIFNMSSNLILAGQALQTLRIKWSSYQERLSRLQQQEKTLPTHTKKMISIIETTTGAMSPLDETLKQKTCGRFLVKGSNGSGKSTLCLKLKAENKSAFYLPAKFENPNFNVSGSTGEIKLAELKWLFEKHADYSMILLDEWDANLDTEATRIADALIQNIAQNCLVFEVRHKEA